MKDMRHLINLMEGLEGNYYSVFTQGDHNQWSHYFDADTIEDANAERYSLRNAGVNVKVFKVPKDQADWTKVDPHLFVVSRLRKDKFMETAPPGMEDVVMKLKKQYPGEHEKAFSTAWSIYNKKHGTNESVPAIDSCNQDNPANADMACAMEEGTTSTMDINSLRTLFEPYVVGQLSASTSRGHQVTGLDGKQYHVMPLDNSQFKVIPVMNETMADSVVSDWDNRLQYLLASYIELDDALNLIRKEMSNEGHSSQEIEEIISSITDTGEPVDFQDMQFGELNESGMFPNVHTFDSTGDAYDASQVEKWNGSPVADGDVLVIPNEQVVGIAHTWPVAVTRNIGSLHQLKSEYHDLNALSTALDLPVDTIMAAVNKAKELGYPTVLDEGLNEFRDMPTDMSDSSAWYLFSFNGNKQGPFSSEEEAENVRMHLQDPDNWFADLGSESDMLSEIAVNGELDLVRGEALGKLRTELDYTSQSDKAVQNTIDWLFASGLLQSNDVDMMKNFLWSAIEDGSAFDNDEIIKDPDFEDDRMMLGLDEDFNLTNGYDDQNFANGQDYFPNGADGPVTKAVGPSGAKQGDNPEQKKMQIDEVHKELVYSYRNYLKESNDKIDEFITPWGGYSADDKKANALKKAPKSSMQGTEKIPFSQLVKDSIEQHGIKWAFDYYVKKHGLPPRHFKIYAGL